MKKFRLEISKPCHQDWSSMTREEKGRFCASCQKTVIDFTEMSDRQLASFFRKPPGELCGRLYNDQLKREISIPKKRIPWFRYFFQFTWPAFVFFLKSCGMKDRTVGQIKLELEHTQGRVQKTADPQSDSDAMYTGTSLGFIMPGQVLNINKPITDARPALKVKAPVTDPRIRKIEEPSLPYPMDSAKNEAESSMVLPESVMDTVRIEYQKYITMGALSIRCYTSVIQEAVQPAPMKVTENKISTYLVYPNPVSQGSMLTITCGEGAYIPDLIQIISSSGQMIFSEEKKSMEESSVFHIRIPGQLPAGVYFLRMANRKTNMLHTEKIRVR